jgi:hypothetical protein
MPANVIVREIKKSIRNGSNLHCDSVMDVIEVEEGKDNATTPARLVFVENIACVSSRVEGEEILRLELRISEYHLAEIVLHFVTSGPVA